MGASGYRYCFRIYPTRPKITMIRMSRVLLPLQYAPTKQQVMTMGSRSMEGTESILMKIGRPKYSIRKNMTFARTKPARIA